MHISSWSLYYRNVQKSNKVLNKDASCHVFFLMCVKERKHSTFDSSASCRAEGGRTRGHVKKWHYFFQDEKKNAPPWWCHQGYRSCICIKLHYGKHWIRVFLELRTKSEDISACAALVIQVMNQGSVRTGKQSEKGEAKDKKAKNKLGISGGSLTLGTKTYW